MRIGKTVQVGFNGHKDATITEGVSPYGNRELTFSQGYGGVVFRPDDIPAIKEALDVFAKQSKSDPDALVTKAMADATSAYKNSSDRVLMRQAFWALKCQSNPLTWLFDKIVRSLDV